jgi:glycosyltransferase involved in cell wall biosynthesis
VALFCRDFTTDGRGAGYADTHLRAAIKNIDKIYFDTKGFLDEIVVRYGLPRSMYGKLEFLPQPVLGDLQEISRDAQKNGASPAIFWAGRFCHQKNTELLGRIIQSLPDVALDVYGGGEPSREVELMTLALAKPKVKLLGPFASFSKIPLEKYSAFLFTSRFEGMPTVIINAAAAGIPIVASNVGGVSELVTSETGWLVDELDDELAYCTAIQEIIENPKEVLRRQKAMKEKVGTERSWVAFKSKLSFLHQP